MKEESFKRRSTKNEIREEHLRECLDLKVSS